jgi:predicted glycosyltransferase
MSLRILVHVQHLLGTGHVRRAAAVAAALAVRGHGVVLASGGPAVPDLALGGAKLVQLPPARAADAAFRVLVHPDGQPVDDSWRDARAALLRELLDRVAPDVVVTELFPFGRRLLEFELLPLLERARARRPRPLIVSSIRDVLAHKGDPAKLARMVARVTALYDRVLVHGDPALIPLAESFPPAEEIAALTAYTGYVRTPAGPAPPPGEGEGEIVVSAGGSFVGRRLLEAALAARPLSAHRNRRWRVLVADTGVPPHREDGLVVERNRPDFTGLCERAHVSVSQAGYNTAVDLLAARTRAVLVPFAAANETEQTLRADAFAARGFAVVLGEHELTPAALAAAIDRAAALAPPAHAVNLDGAERSAALIEAWAGA